MAKSKARAETSASGSASNVNEESVTTQKAFRTHAKRSCKTCQQRKTRCELPTVDLVPSPDALPDELACRRCRNLRLPCVVSAPIRSYTSNPNKRKKTSSDQDETPSTSTSPTSSSSTSLIPSFNSNSNASSASSLSSFQQEESAPTTLIHFWTPPGTPPQTNRKRKQKEGSYSSHQDESTFKENYLLFPSPTALLNELMLRQPGFGKSLPSTRTGAYSIDRIITSLNDSLVTMEKHVLIMLLWLPHLPTIKKALQEFQESPNPTSRLLLCCLYLITLPPSHPSRTELQASLRRLIQQDLLLVIMSISNLSSIRTIQVLELTAVYTPLSCTIDPGTHTPSISGSHTLATAVHIARALGLDQSLLELKRLKEAISLSGLSTGFSVNSNLNQECSNLAEKAILWNSLCAWSSHFKTFDVGLDPTPSSRAKNESVYDTSNEDLDFDPEVSHLVSSFTHSFSNYEEVQARQAGAIGGKHRRLTLDLSLRTKPQLLKASQLPLGLTRANELKDVLENYFSLVSENDAARELEFSSIPQGILLTSLVNWSRVESTSIRSVFVSCALGILVKELVEMIGNPTAFFQKARDHNLLEFMTRYGTTTGEDQTNMLQQQFPSLSGQPFPELPSLHASGAPSHSTCSLIVWSTMRVLETSASVYAAFGSSFNQAPKIIEYLTRTSRLLSQMDSDFQTVEGGSICKTSARIVFDMVKTIRIWEKKTGEKDFNSIEFQRNRNHFKKQKVISAPNQVKSIPNSHSDEMASMASTSQIPYQPFTQNGFHGFEPSGIPMASTSNAQFNSQHQHQFQSMQSGSQFDQHGRNQLQITDGNGQHFQPDFDAGPNSIDLDGLLGGMLWWESLPSSSSSGMDFHPH